MPGSESSTKKFRNYEEARAPPAPAGGDDATARDGLSTGTAPAGSPATPAEGSVPVPFSSGPPDGSTPGGWTLDEALPAMIANGLIDGSPHPKGPDRGVVAVVAILLMVADAAGLAALHRDRSCPSAPAFGGCGRP